MDAFEYQHGELYAEGVPIREIARSIGSPCFVYSRDTIRGHVERFTRAFAAISPSVHYAVKANNNLRILRELRSLGVGMDVVSGGELERAWLAGTPMEDIVFAGVGKTERELRAAMDGGSSLLHATPELIADRDPTRRGVVGQINVESGMELERVARVAEALGVRPRVAVRVNPDIDAGTHAYTTTGTKENKFGVSIATAESLIRTFAGHAHVDVRGLHVHLGSPIYRPEVFERATRIMLDLIDRMRGLGQTITHLDLGGGFGADYRTGETPAYADYADGLIALLRDHVADGLRVAFEPGRTIMGNAGVLVVRVEYVKEEAGKRFVVCDAGMNALIRPALYDAFHFVWPVAPRNGRTPRTRDGGERDGLVVSDVVGPICESSDFLAKSWAMPEVGQGDLLAVFTAGAYGMSMASTYNDHPLPGEVLVDGERAEVSRGPGAVGALIEPSLQSRPIVLRDDAAREAIMDRSSGELA